MELASWEAPQELDGVGVGVAAHRRAAGRAGVRPRSPQSKVRLRGGSSGLSAPHVVSPCCTERLSFPLQMFGSRGRKKQKQTHAFPPTAPAEQVPRGTLISLQIKVSRVVLLSGHFVNSQIVFSSV